VSKNITTKTEDKIKNHIKIEINNKQVITKRKKKKNLNLNFQKIGKKIA
jgi:hypothetical protein